MPRVKMAQSLLHHPRVDNQRDDPHRALADGTAQQVNVPTAQDQVAPFL
jgi:hypothetical protein